MSTLITLRRRGTFTVVDALGNRKFQCGSPMMTTLHYGVAITVTPDALDKRGFILANEEVDEMIKRKFHLMEDFPSCEQMAQEVVEMLRARITKGAKAISVIMSGWPGLTELECTWHSADSVDMSPQVCRPAPLLSKMD